LLQIQLIFYFSFANSLEKLCTIHEYCGIKKEEYSLVQMSELAKENTKKCENFN
jgi:hypothetical protein